MLCVSNNGFKDYGVLHLKCNNENDSQNSSYLVCFKNYDFHLMCSV